MVDVVGLPSQRFQFVCVGLSLRSDSSKYIPLLLLLCIIVCVYIYFFIYLFISLE